MRIWERGKENERSLLFFPCTAEPVWAFEGTLRLLARKWHVFQVIYDGHQMETPGDFTSVEQTVDEVVAYLKQRGVARLDAAYGCSLGGACLTRLLALGKMPVGRAVIDGGLRRIAFRILCGSWRLRGTCWASRSWPTAAGFWKPPFRRNVSRFRDITPGKNTTT